SQAIYIAALGFIFGKLFALRDVNFIPFLTAGILLWSFISSCMTEGSSALITKKQELLDGSGNPLSFVLQIIFRNGIVFLHHIVVFVVVAVIYSVTPDWWLLLFLPVGFALILLNVVWMSGFLSLLIPRYRDLEPLVPSLVQICFFLTPIMWHPTLLGAQEKWVNVNPFYHLIELIRSPLLGDGFPTMSFGISIAFLFLGVGMTYLLLSRVCHRLSFWV
ncbi:MAG: ABC transporter permease, partial [Verrucomicrobiota bacterium]